MENLSKELAKEMYESGNQSIKDFALRHFTEQELIKKEFPKSWEELGEISGDFIDKSCNVNLYTVKNTAHTYSQNIIPKGLGQPILDLIKLLQVRDRYREIEGYEGINKCLYFLMTTKLTEGYNFETPFNFKSARTGQEFEKNFAKELESVSKIYL